MSKANSRLKSVVGTKQPKPQLVEAKAIPAPDTTNKSGAEAYKQDKWLKLLTMLNTLKLQAQYYRTEQETLTELKVLIVECAQEDPYFTCQCIVYSRCLGEGMRTVSHAASIFIAPFISGQTYAKNFYSRWDKKAKKGGVIYRPDDMFEITSGFVALNGDYKITTITDVRKGTTEQTVDVSGTKLTNAMKKGFREAIENMDSYTLLKYKSKLIDIINLVRPNPVRSGQIVEIEGKEVYTIEAIMKGMKASANTWEVNQGEAGQIVAQAVKEGRLDEKEAKEMLTEAKSENWKELLLTNKLGILAAIRNLRNILKNNPDAETVEALCSLVSNATKIKEGKIMPFQIDVANDILMSEFNDPNSRKVSSALLKGFEAAIPNLALMLPGTNCVFLDLSGSMYQAIRLPNGKRSVACAAKAALIAATIAKATHADIIGFGGSAKKLTYNPNVDVFTLAKQLNAGNMGWTDISAAWKLANSLGTKYTRVFILSDNEANRGSTYASYMSYVKNQGSPYVYSIDLAGYGTNCIAGDKVRYYFGYGLSMFEDIANSEFNPSYHIDKVKQIEL